MSENRFQRNGKQRYISFPWYFLNNENNSAQQNMLATNAKMVRKELKNGVLYLGTNYFQIVALCFEMKKMI